MLRFLRSFAGFDLFPAGQHFSAVVGLGIRKNVRVATLEFVTDGGTNIIEIKAPFFLGYLCVKHDLKQQIAQLTAQIVKILTGNRVKHFVGFFKGVRGERGESLFVIPRTAGFRVAQALHDAKQAVNLGHWNILKTQAR